MQLTLLELPHYSPEGAEFAEVGIEISFDNDRILSPKSLSSEMSLAVFSFHGLVFVHPIIVKVDSHF